MKLLLCRHGNTFGPGDTPVWVGKTQDLPLVESGRNQAHAVATAIEKHHAVPAAVYCASLRRTREFADILIRHLKFPSPPVIDERLDELDYGDWGGLTGEEVKRKFGSEAVTAWETNAIMPTNCHWDPTAAVALAEAQSFISEMHSRHGADDSVVVVTSNGRLKFFAKALSLRNVGKVATGHVCRIEIHEQHSKVDFWNIAPLEWPAEAHSKISELKS